MMQRQTTLTENGLIWCGAGISIAEILTGTYLASLGLMRGLAVILIGHLVGCLLLFLAGVIGGQRRLSAMVAAQLSFGRQGSKLFAGLNVLQLVGWTGIMIYDGAVAAAGIWPIGRVSWAVVIGALIILWLLIGIRHLRWFNLVTIGILLALTAILCRVIFAHHQVTPASGHLTGAQGLELVIAMPLSWLPLISDYTSAARRPVAASGVSALVYGVTSCWMAFIGLGAALLTHDINIATIILRAGLGSAGLLIVVFSTVTTTFMDAYSAGVSSRTIVPRWSGSGAAIVATVLGTLGALVLPMDNFSDFLYLIGSVFAPMVAIQLTDYFILRVDHHRQPYAWGNLAIWLIGFILYRWLMTLNWALGSTIPTILAVVLLTWFVGREKSGDHHINE